jgi:hypothetical protein
MKKLFFLAVVLFVLPVVCSAMTPVYFGSINSSSNSVISGTALIQEVDLTNATTIAVMINFRSSPSLTSKGAIKKTVIVPTMTSAKASTGGINYSYFVIELSTTTPSLDVGVSTNALITATVWKE